MIVSITNMDSIPSECRKCRYFWFRDMTGDEKYMLNARCSLIEPTQDWYAKEAPDKHGGWIGEDLDEIKGRNHGYYPYNHAVEVGTRAKQCPLREVEDE